jgi:hypothetical protein
MLRVMQLADGDIHSSPANAVVYNAWHFAAHRHVLHLKIMYKYIPQTPPVN